MAESGHTPQVVEELTISLGDRIANGEIPLGGWIRQAKVAAEHNVSRTPVSLALNRLEAIGVLERVPNRGFRVRVPSYREIMEVVEVRELLEGRAVALAAERITEAQLRRLRDSVAELRELVRMIRDGGDPEAAAAQWQRSYGSFHRTIFEAAGNSQLQGISDALYRKVPRGITWRALQNDPRMLTRIADECEHIAAAIDNRDAISAQELTVAHIEAVRDFTLAHLPSPD
ncbi:GntR family transcriptional regulator [Sciscionella marina]|uniref:GntR family transcriptional regulator n=1 Tax=Sciscionella marina TaxID=508770 RepID=UPI00036425CF|nr:GntR family transcriptional regulator [Sciscionella marina]